MITLNNIVKHDPLLSDVAAGQARAAVSKLVGDSERLVSRLCSDPSNASRVALYRKQLEPWHKVLAQLQTLQEQAIQVVAAAIPEGLSPPPPGWRDIAVWPVGNVWSDSWQSEWNNGWQARELRHQLYTRVQTPASTEVGLITLAKCIASHWKEVGGFLSDGAYEELAVYLIAVCGTSQIQVNVEDHSWWTNWAYVL